jgi:hypothetical protein
MRTHLLLAVATLAPAMAADPAAPDTVAEITAVVTLKSQILPAEVQFEAGVYVDEDGNGIGEYGFISEMCGRVKVQQTTTLNFLGPVFQTVENGVSGYHYAVFLPDGEHQALAEPFPGKRADDPAAVGLREHQWIAYAWPVDRNQGQQVFVINDQGVVYASHPADPTAAPAWNALMGGGDHGWKDKVGSEWVKFRQRIPAGPHHVEVQEALAAKNLKSQILPAEVQFQAGAYVDEEGKQNGDYGFLSEMSDEVQVGGIDLNLLGPVFQPGAKGFASVDGYTYAVYLPDGPHAAIGEPFPGKRVINPAGIILRQRYWVAYCWPVDQAQGTRMFAINQAGKVYATPVADPIVVPAWNALMGGGDKGWTDAAAPGWVPYHQ